MNALIPFSCDAAGLPTVEEVTSLLRQYFIPSAGRDEVPLTQAGGRILADPLQARLSMPPCDRSAMDGYAFRFDDARTLQVAGRAPAGKPFGRAIEPGQCVEIGTGGALPRGCDSVAMQEDCATTPHGILVAARARGDNVRRRGEDFNAGDNLLQAGTRLMPRHIGLLAAAGIETVPVRRRLRIALYSIGDELNSAEADSIADANRPMLRALCVTQGFDVTDLGILPDNRDAIAAALEKAAPCHDVVLCSAGSCEGDNDHTRSALLQAGGMLLVAGVAIRPGKPVSLGMLGAKPYIALPGNPGAAYITFLILALPLLQRLSGASPTQPNWQMARASFDHRKKAGLREYVRICVQRAEDGTLCAGKASNNGSAMLRSLAEADGLACFAEQCTDIRAGDMIAIAPFTGLEMS